VLCDQHLGNRRASVVKLSGTVRGLAEQHHARLVNMATDRNDGRPPPIAASGSLAL
jgi:hypothetical protein